jgi:hypothetical protein
VFYGELSFTRFRIRRQENQQRLKEIEKEQQRINGIRKPVNGSLNEAIRHEREKLERNETNWVPIDTPEAQSALRDRLRKQH